MTRRILCTAGLLCLLHQAQAQKGINAYYSAFGIGDLEERDYSRNFGLGSTGIGRPSTDYLNEQNPASYGRLPLQQFFFDAAIAGKAVQYNGNGQSQSAGDLNFARFALGFKAHKNWGLSIGLTPYSRVDYKFLNKTAVEGTGNSVGNAVEGSGNLNRLYFSNGIQLGKNFSIGGTAALLFGPVSTTDSLGSAGVYSYKRVYYRGMEWTGGLQYNGHVGDWELGAGLTYRVPLTLKGEETFSLRQADESETVLYEEERNDRSFRLPEQTGAGLYLSDGRLKFLADYKEQRWKGLNESKIDYGYTNLRRYAAGMEYSLFRDNYISKTEHLIVQAGVSYSTGYLRVKGEQVSDFAVSLGASLPSRTGHLRYYLGLEGGQRGRNVKGLVQENYFNVVLNLSLRDNWFFKFKEM
ncbi:hypothetical protein ACWKWU_15220 [Chitinophaga lutea]